MSHRSRAGEGWRCMKKGWNGVEKEAVRPWGGRFPGGWLKGGTGLWVSRGPFHVQFY